MRRKTLYRIVYIFLDIVLLACIVFVMFAFELPVKPQKMACNAVNITISENVTDNFLSAADIKDLLSSRSMFPLDQPIDSINTRKIEDYLRANPLIKNAECYRTVSGAININVEERTAVMRVKSDNGDDYYLDESGSAIFKFQYPVDVIVVTGRINKIYAHRYLAKMGSFIVHDDFWKNQIEQIHVLPDGDVELIPRVGEHVIFIGRPTGIKTKLERVRKFYKYALNDIGWNKYSVISVDIPNQIVCKKKQ